MMNKVLVITYYWPPSGGGGVQRWLKFTKYLPQFGWEPIVLTPANPSVLEQDQSLEKEIPNTTRVIKIPIWEPYGIASRFFNMQTVPQQGIVYSSKSPKFSLLTWLRGNFMIPDTRIFWKKPAVKKVLELIDQEQIKLIVTTGPPHSMHLIGLKVRKQRNITWIADFRDPWADWDILDQMKLTKIARKKHEQLERKVLSSADGAITVSQSWANDLSKKHKKNIKVITNGFDPRDTGFSGKKSNKKFQISHFGLINEFRNVNVLWETLEELCAENTSFNEALSVFLAGNTAQNVKDQLLSSQIAEKVNMAGYLPHEALIEEYQKTSVFLLLSNKSKNSKGHIPGKLFEYLASRGTIMAFSDQDGDVAQIINSTNSGYVLSATNAKQVKIVLVELYAKFRNNDLSGKANEISKYERSSLSRELAAYFDELLSKSKY